MSQTEIESIVNERSEQKKDDVFEWTNECCVYIIAQHSN